MNRKIFVRIVAIVLAVLIAGSIIFGVLSSTTVSAVSKAELEKLESEQESIQQKQQEIKSKINSLEYEQATAIAKKEVLDEQILLTNQEIDNITDQIAEFVVLIEQKAEEVKEAQKAEKDQWELYKVRMRAMEENGTISYYAIIFGASSFADMLARIDEVSMIMESDEHLYEDLVDARKATEDAKTALEETKAEQEVKKVELQEKEAELQTRVDEAAALIQEIENNLEESEALYAESVEEENRINEEIAEMEAALEKMSAGAVVGTGAFLWPSDISVRVTSPFGTRLHPIYGTYRTHNGIDIGGVGYNSNVVASDGGTVLTAQYSSSYGNYVTISHGNGYTTLYAHMNSLAVSAGDAVSQGEVIGYTGSTGNSTGPHIHYEIWYQGTRVNPLDYFSNYVQAW